MPQEMTARQKQLLILAEARRKKALAEGDTERPTGGFKNLVQRWNKGLVDFINAPTDLINAGLRLGVSAWSAGMGRPQVDAPQIPGTESLRQHAYNLGLTPDPNVPASGIAENAMEILGAGALPTMALSMQGANILNQSIVQLNKLGIVDHLAASTAARPLATAAGEAAASFGAATGRVVAEENEASQSVTIMAELLGGFTPAALIGVAGNVSLLRVMASSINKHLLPMTKAGAEPRAAARLQSLAANPREAAARIDIESPVSPARQTGDKRLLSLERAILKENPVLDEELETVLTQVRVNLKSEASMFGGDVNRPRELLKNGRQYLLDLVDMRAAKASSDVAESLRKLDPNATPREISETVRIEVDKAYTDARATERELWGSIDSGAPVKLPESRKALDSVIATRSDYSDPEDIPEWVVNALKPRETSPEVMAQLAKAGLVDKNGNIVPSARQALVDQGVIAERPYSFNDARTIRSRLLDEIRAERAKPAPNRNKIRILDEIATGIVDDLGNSGVEGAQVAREFSAQLNTRFTSGKVGRLLGYERAGAKAVTERGTLDFLLSGRDPAMTITQLTAASPTTKPMVENYLKSLFLEQVSTDAGMNTRVADRFIKNWEARGAFEVFPGLKDELLSVKNLADGATKLNVRADKVRSFAYSSGKSRAALYLGKDPGDEMGAVLNSKRPIATARGLYAKLFTDREAVKGLQTSFIEEGFRRSASGSFHPDGDPIYSGKKFTKFLDEYRAVAKSIGINDEEFGRLENIALKMRQVEIKPSGEVSTVLDDIPSAILDLAARWVGARSGGQLGNSLGSGMVMAQAFSQRTRKMLSHITRNRAEELLIAATKDAKLYRSLLITPKSSVKAQERASATIEAWLVGVGAIELAETEEE